MTFWEKVTDKYITWRTGKDKQQRDWEAWYNVNVVWRAHDITNMFMNFKYVFEVDWYKFFDHEEMGCWIPCPDAKQYFYPQRELGNNAVWRIERVIKDQWDLRWHINEIAGYDKVFVATNNERDAMMIALKYS